MRFYFEPLKNDPKRGWIRLNEGAKLKYAFVEWIGFTKQWTLREMSWLTQINADHTMKSNKAVTPNELIELGNFIKEIPKPVKQPEGE